MNKIIVVALCCVGSLQAIDSKLIRYGVHAVASPLLNHVTSLAGQGNAQISWTPSQAFGAQATYKRGFDYQWSSSSPYGNLAGLLLPVGHALALYHLPQITDNAMQVKGSRNELQNVASFLLRNGSACIDENNAMQLSCGVSTQAPQLSSIVQCLVAEMIVQQLP
jgi:hypothetical protein